MANSKQGGGGNQSVQSQMYQDLEKAAKTVDCDAL